MTYSGKFMPAYRRQAAEEGLLMSAPGESHAERYTEHNTKPDPRCHLIRCRTDGCTYTDTHCNPCREIHFLARRMCLSG